MNVVIYLVDGLSHVVLLHWNVVANQLLHGSAQLAVFQELLDVLLVLCSSTEGQVIQSLKRQFDETAERHYSPTQTHLV